MKFYGRVESSLRANHSYFGGDPVQDQDPGFLNQDPDHLHTAAVLSPLGSLGGSIILGSGLCCSGTDFLVSGASAVYMVQQRFCKSVVITTTKTEPKLIDSFTVKTMSAYRQSPAIAAYEQEPLDSLHQCKRINAYQSTFPLPDTGARWVPSEFTLHTEMFVRTSN